MPGACAHYVRREGTSASIRAMYYALLYDYVDDMQTRREPVRPAHLEKIRAAHGAGDLVMAGAFTDPIDSALIVFQGDSPAAAEAFANGDPYNAAGLITGWRVRRWEVNFGTQRAEPYYVLRYSYVDDMLAQREPVRPAHVARVREAFRMGDMVAAGPLMDPTDGALLVFQGDSPAAAEAFAQADPYNEAGLITHWDVRPWAVVVGGGGQ